MKMDSVGTERIPHRFLSANDIKAEPQKTQEIRKYMNISGPASIGRKRIPPRITDKAADDHPFLKKKKFQKKME